MKIIFVVPQLYNCGPVNVVFNLVKELYRNNEIRVVSLRSTSENSMLKDFSKYCGLGVFENILSYSKDKYLKLFSGFDVVHSHGYYPDKLVSKLKIDIKKISTIHCMFYKDYPKEYGYLKGILGAYLHYNMFKKNNFSSIVCCSDSVKKSFLTYVNHHDVFSINNGVDHFKFNQLISDDEENLKKELKISDSKRVFLYSGRLIRRKRVPELIDYFNKKSRKSDILLILGDGPEIDLCKKKAIFGNIIFLGNVDKPERYYKISDFVISMSSAEGYPMSIVEAVSSGCYALLSENESHLEFVQKNHDLSCIIDFNSELPEKECYSKFDKYHLSSKFMASKYIDIYQG